VVRREVIELTLRPLDLRARVAELTVDEVARVQVAREPRLLVGVDVGFRVRRREEGESEGSA